MKFFKSRHKQSSNNPQTADAATTVANQAAEFQSPAAIDAAPIISPAAASMKLDRYDLHTLVKKISTITTDYNQTRAQLQAQLFAELEEQRETRRTVKQDLAQTNHRIDDLNQQLAKALDNTDLTQQVASADEQLQTLQAQIDNQQVTLKTLTAQLVEQTKKQRALANQQQHLTTTRQRIVQTLHAEQDPLKLLASVETYRTQLEQLAGQLQQVSAQQTATRAQQTQLTTATNVNKQQLQQLKKQLAAAQATKMAAKQAIQLRAGQQSQQLADLATQLDQLTANQQRATAHLAKLNTHIKLAKQQLLDWFGTTHQVRQLNTDNEHHYVVALDSFLPQQPDALVQTVTRLLAAGASTVGLYSALFDINLVAELEVWADQNQLDQQQLTIINPLYQLQNQGIATGERVQLPTNIADQQWDAANHVRTVTLTDNHGQLKVDYQTDDDTRIKAISYLTNGHLIKRSFFNQHGLLAANALFDADGALTQEQYYRLDGLVSLIVDYQAGQQVNVKLFNSSGIQTNTFTNTATFTTWWLAHYLPQPCAMVGLLENDTYQQLMQQPQIKAVPFISATYTHSAQLTTYLQQTTQTQFIVANYQTAQVVIQNSPGNLELLYLNPVYLPAQIDNPRQLASS